MNKKDVIGDLFNQLRLRRQRLLVHRSSVDEEAREDPELEATLGQMLMVMDHLDTLIGRVAMHLPYLVPAQGQHALRSFVSCCLPFQ